MANKGPSSLSQKAVVDTSNLKIFFLLEEIWLKWVNASGNLKVPKVEIVGSAWCVVCQQPHPVLSSLFSTRESWVVNYGLGLQLWRYIWGGRGQQFYQGGSNQAWMSFTLILVTLALNKIWVFKNSSKVLYMFSLVPDLYWIRGKRFETFPLQL